MKRQSSTQACASPASQAITASKPNIWSSLTDDEAASIAQWLFSQPSFNLTATADAGEWDNSVYVAITKILSITLMVYIQTDD